MARGKTLSDFEKGQIEAYNHAGRSNREIARLLDRSHHLVDSYLTDPARYGTRKSTGRIPQVSDQDKRRIWRRASNSTITCRQIKRELGLTISIEWIRRLIHANPFIRRRKMRRAPTITAQNKEKRLKFCQRNMRQDWSKVSKSTKLNFSYVS